MSVEIEDVLGLFDAPKELVEGLKKGEKTLDDLKAFKDAGFVARSMAYEDDEIKSKITGKVLGSLTTKAKQHFGLENKDIEGKKIEEVLEIGAKKLTSQIEELKSLQTAGGDKAAQEIQKKLEKAQSEITEYKTMAENATTLLEQEKGAFNQKIKSFKLNSIFSGAKQKVAFKDGMTEIEKTGFDSLIQSKYKFELNDSDEPEIIEVATGQRKKTESGNKFMTLDELLSAEAKANNLLKVNNTQGGKPAGTFFGGQPQTPPATPTPGQPVRRIHPKALQNEQRK